MSPTSDLAADGVLLFAHGARDPAWAGPFEGVAARLRAQAPGLKVALGFLEFMQPSLAEAGAARCAPFAKASDLGRSSAEGSRGSR